MGFFKQLFADNSHREVDANQVDAAPVANSHIVVDVREHEEWIDGHIAEAIHIPLGDLAHRLDELPPETPIYTVCRSGVRSLTAVEILESAGRTEAKSMAGGMIAWTEASKPIAR